MSEKQVRKDDRFMRGMMISLFLSAFIGVGGWLYTLIVIQSDVSYLKAEQKRTADYFKLVIELKAAINNLAPVIQDTNAIVRTFGTEQAKRGPIVYKADRHMGNRKLHN